METESFQMLHLLRVKRMASLMVEKRGDAEIEDQNEADS